MPSNLCYYTKLARIKALNDFKKEIHWKLFSLKKNFWEWDDYIHDECTTKNETKINVREAFNKKKTEKSDTHHPTLP